MKKDEPNRYRLDRSIQVVCQHLTNPDADDRTLIRSISAAASVYYNYTGQNKCNNIKTGDSDRLGQDGWNFQVSGKRNPSGQPN